MLIECQYRDGRECFRGIQAHIGKYEIIDYKLREEDFGMNLDVAPLPESAYSSYDARAERPAKPSCSISSQSSGIVYMSNIVGYRFVSLNTSPRIVAREGQDVESVVPRIKLNCNEIAEVRVPRSTPSPDVKHTYTGKKALFSFLWVPLSYSDPSSLWNQHTNHYHRSDEEGDEFEEDDITIPSKASNHKSVVME